MNNYPQNSIFLDHNLKLYKMIDMYLKYDNMHTNELFNAIICINNHLNSCMNCMLSVTHIRSIDIDGYKHTSMGSYENFINPMSINKRRTTTTHRCP